jgi:NAD(P)-dependent dehydrogenase (short-subunit alcohol dehydrogenase family)
MSAARRSAPLAVRLDRQHAIVTGAGRGIGRSIALSLLEAGAGVTLVARSGDELDEVAGEAASLDGDAFVHVADVRSEDEVEAAVDAAMANGGLDICVNCAGINRPGPTVDTAVEDFEAIIDTNLKGAFLVCRAVGRRLIEAGRGGRIINISSQLGAVGYPGRAPYCASKHGLDGLTRALGVEWAKYGILVNSIAPTFVYTPLTRPFFDDPAFKDDVLRRMPIGRIMESDELNGSVLFLCSDAATMVTGQVLRCDGGWTAW